MTRDDIIGWMQEVGAKKNDLTPQTYDGFVDIFQRFAALVAAAEQRPITDVTEAVTKTVIDVEKLLCEKIGRQWQPSGMSIQTLVDELAALVAAAEREACAKVAESFDPEQLLSNYGLCIANKIRARGET